MLASKGRQGDNYILTPPEIEAFKKNGYVHLKEVLSEDEVASLEEEYMKFLRREIHVEGRDFCDMSGDYAKALDEYSIINIMLPSRYNPALRGSVYEKRAASIAQQLCGPEMVFDYDQLLAKPPNRTDGVFSWHQDLAYWPVTKDTRTASLWLAIDNSCVENGCLRFVAGSHLEQKLRHHGPLHGDRDTSHTLAARLSETDVEVPVEISRGDVTVHQERTLHGSGGNFSPNSWRRAWVLAFRSKSTVEEERHIGFTHSHNDSLQVLNKVGIEGMS